MRARRVSALVLLVLGLLLLLPPVGRRFEDAVWPGLSGPAQSYLDASTKRAVTGFVTASGVKAALAVVEGSEVGFSFVGETSLQVGDVVQSTYDYVDIAWKTLFWSSVVLVGIQFLLSIAGWLGPVALGLTFLAIGLGLLATPLPWARRRFGLHLEQITSLLVVLTLFTFVVLPASVRGSARLSAHLTAPYTQAGYEMLDQLHTSVAPLQNDDGLLQNPRKLKDALGGILDAVRGELGSLGMNAVGFIVGYLFDCLVFPLGLAWLGVRAARALTGYLERNALARSVVRDMRETVPAQ